MTCNPHNRIEKYYCANKARATVIYDSYKYIENILSIKRMVLRNNFWGENMSVNLGLREGPNVGFAFDKKSAELLYGEYSYQFDDSLMMKNYLKLDSLVRSEVFKSFLKKVIDSKYRQIEAKENYFFMTMGDRAKHSSHPDMQTGLLFTTDEKYLTYRHYIRKIDDNVYIYESVVP